MDLKAKELADAAVKLKEQEKAMEQKKKDDLEKKEKKDAAKKLRKKQKKKEKAKKAIESSGVQDAAELLRVLMGIVRGSCWRHQRYECINT